MHECVEGGKVYMDGCISVLLKEGKDGWVYECVSVGKGWMGAKVCLGRERRTHECVKGGREKMDRWVE